MRNRRISMATAVLMVTDSTRNIKKKFSAAVAPEPLPEVSTSEIINSDHGSVSLAAVSQASASEDMPCDQKMRSLISSCPSVDSNSVSDEHLLEEARLIGAAMDTTSLNAKDEPPVMEGRSLGCLSPTSRIRRACFNIATNRYFEWLVMLCIVASGVRFAMLCACNCVSFK